MSKQSPLRLLSEVGAAAQFIPDEGSVRAAPASRTGTRTQAATAAFPLCAAMYRADRKAVSDALTTSVSAPSGARTSDKVPSAETRTSKVGGDVGMTPVKRARTESAGPAGLSKQMFCGLNSGCLQNATATDSASWSSSGMIESGLPSRP